MLSHCSQGWREREDLDPAPSSLSKPHNLSCGAAVQRRTRDRKVAGSTPGRGAIMAGVKAGVFACVWWQVTQCDPIWQVTSRSCEMVYH